MIVPAITPSWYHQKRQWTLNLLLRTYDDAGRQLHDAVPNLMFARWSFGEWCKREKIEKEEEKKWSSRCLDLNKSVFGMRGRPAVSDDWRKSDEGIQNEISGQWVSEWMYQMQQSSNQLHDEAWWWVQSVDAFIPCMIRLTTVYLFQHRGIQMKQQQPDLTWC